MRNSSLRVALLLASAFTAQADIIIVEGDNPQDDENIVFNRPGTDRTGNPVIGAGNQTEFLFQFNSSTTLNAPSAGQARVEGGFDDIRLSMLDVDLGFTSAIFNLNATQTGTVTINVNWVSPSTSSTTSEQFSYNVNNQNNPNQGQNFFTVTAENNQVIRSIDILTSNALADIRQVRIGGVTDLDNPGQGGGEIPEPMTMSLFGAGLGVIALIRRRTRQS
jgi:hypothetical protein